MIRSIKRITALSLSVLLLSIGSTAYAAGGDDEKIHYPHSIKINEKSEHLGEELYDVDKKFENDISPLSTTVVYEAGGYAGNPVASSFGYNDRYH